MPRFLFLVAFCLAICHSASAQVPPSASTAAVAAPAVVGDSVTLRQCFEWATNRSEDLKIREEYIVQAKARARTALADALPRVEWQFRNTWQDPNGVDELNRQGFGGFVEKNQMESNFSVQQPLFSGGREFAARSGFTRESTRDTLRLQRATRELFERTAEAFYRIVTEETNHINTHRTLTLAQERVKDLRSFLRLGKARESELFSAQARAAALEGTMRQIAGRLLIAREELSFLTGQDLTARPLLDEIPSPPAVGTLEQALAQAGSRTDVKAQREEVEARKLRTRYERGSFWPNADIEGRYYTQRATFLDVIDWDILLSLNVPIYQGGAVEARVKEAQSAERQARWTLEEMERRIASTIRRTHGELSAALEETAALQEAAQAAQKSYDALRKEYRLGLTTNLEVLEALDQVQTQQSAFDTARLRAKQHYLRLGVAVEKLP
jgi:outer membrane protein TolC